ncbi:MAG: hypothetical protein J7647_32745 [Cyanobacteria bacterium SBLK]|nr:hypothetical protein [Cyanobacteria bacterium SBLK]
MPTLTQAPQTAQRRQLTPARRQLTAQVATWDAIGTATYQASDIAAVTVHDGMVDIYFTEGGKTIVPVEQFKAKVKEFKAESQLSEDQEEIIEAAIDAPFEAEINFQDAIASFYSDEDGFLGTVRKERYIWTATTESTATVHKTAFDAVQSLTTCTYSEWEEAKDGLEGIRYEGNGYWLYSKGRVNTRNLLDILKLSKSDRQIAIVEQRIPMAD